MTPEDTRDELLVYFSYKQLPPKLQDVSRPFCELANRIGGSIPAGDQLTEALRKLLEAKDCAVRAAL